MRQKKVYVAYCSYAVPYHHSTDVINNKVSKKNGCTKSNLKLYTVSEIKRTYTVAYPLLLNRSTAYLELCTDRKLLKFVDTSTRVQNAA